MSVGQHIQHREHVRSPRRLRARLGLRLSVGSISFLAASGDLVIVVAAALISAVFYHAYFLRGGVNVESYAAIGAICFLNFLIIGAARKSYQTETLLQFPHQAREVILIWPLVAMLSLSLIFAAKESGNVSRGAVALFFVAALFALLGWRRVLGVWMARAMGSGTLSTRRMILIADRDELIPNDVLRKIGRAGYSPTATLTYGPSPSAECLRELAEEAIRVTKERPVDTIMLMANWSHARVIDQVVSALHVLPLSVHLLADQRTAGLIQGGSSAIPGLAAAQVQRAPLTNAERAVKRAFDVVLASVGLVVVSPLFVIVPLLIKAESRGPVLFHQTRVGFNERPFRILKFRTMTVMEDGAEFRQVTRGDPRITRLGRWLRKTSIDELPQLWNVIRGDMSMVGPRPHPTALDDEYQTSIGSYAFRHHVKPGLTGWAQVHGLRGETSTLDQMQSRVDRDFHYINHWSIFLDVLIVLLTVRVVFRDPAAF